MVFHIGWHFTFIEEIFVLDYFLPEELVSSYLG